ncbi:acetate/propionate family kinase [Marinicellulosiphila megalodicopiae]|uniref:acetate/propionate family kinase n=1 Tax=Marinicellulosiphila megalodicopiae TaxID=2724896 RepID=UPI003BB07D0D
MTHQILVFNSGSSSFKFSLFEQNNPEPILNGLAEQLGQTQASITIKYKQSKFKHNIANADHKTAILFLLDQFKKLEINLDHIHAIGHRVVHGGEYFSDSVIIDDQVIHALENCSALAPLHNPANIEGIKIMQSIFQDTKQIAVFDTAFHQSLPSKAYLYALPYQWYKQQGVRRYGFHGTSHKYVAQRAKEILNLNDNHQIITVHLGNGCSASAIKDSKSIDTTMGMTPLEGLVMGTRCGDIDASILQFMQQKMGWSLDEITNKLNKASGLLGLSELSNDMRTLVEAKEKGHEQAGIAIDVFCFKLAKQIMALATSLTSIDALIFTGGIGENSSFIRSQVIQNLTLLGFKIDETLNKNPDKQTGRISSDQSTLCMVINTNEEWMIAQDCTRLTSTTL